MTDIELSTADLPIFEHPRPGDLRPRNAVDAAREFADDDHTVRAHHLDLVRDLAGATVVGVLRRYPNAPGGSGRVGELMRALDASLRTI